MSSKIFLIGFITLFASFSFIEKANAEDLQVQAVINSEKYNVPYLALTAEEVAAEKNLASLLVLEKAGKICRSLGYRSAVDFDFETGHEKTSLAYFDDENIEHSIEVERKLKPWKIGFDASYVLLLTSFSFNSIFYHSVPIARSIIFKGIFITAGLGISNGLSHILAERMDGIKLEGTYRKYYVYFSSIDCLEAGEDVSNEQIAEYEIRYSCNVLQDNDSACNEASLREAGCLVSLSSKDDSKEICKDLATNIQDDRKFQCAVADIGDYDLSSTVCNI